MNVWKDTTKEKESKANLEIETEVDQTIKLVEIKVLKAQLSFLDLRYLSTSFEEANRMQKKDNNSKFRS